jgi:magnesium transporter
VRQLNTILDGLTAGFEKYGIGEELRRYLRDVQDHAIEVAERVEGFRQLLQNILSVNLALVSLQQNDEVKKVSAWAAILFAPTVIGTVYGMNFNHMPELHWEFGYPFALLLMALVRVLLYVVFKRRGWL